MCGVGYHCHFGTLSELIVESVWTATETERFVAKLQNLYLNLEVSMSRLATLALVAMFAFSAAEVTAKYCQSKTAPPCAGVIVV